MNDKRTVIANDADFNQLENPEIAFKKPAWLIYESAKEEQVVQTKEGPQTAQPGDAIVTGIMGERWPIPQAKHAGYDFKEENGVTSISKKLALVAVSVAK